MQMVTCNSQKRLAYPNTGKIKVTNADPELNSAAVNPGAVYSNKDSQLNIRINLRVPYKTVRICTYHTSYS